MIFGNEENKVKLGTSTATKQLKFLCKKKEPDHIFVKQDLNLSFTKESSNFKKGFSEHLNTSEKLNPNSQKIQNKNVKFHCNCKNSQCLKLYCDCFSVLSFCDPSVCTCQGCSNLEENEVILFKYILIDIILF